MDARPFMPAASTVLAASWYWPWLTWIFVIPMYLSSMHRPAPDRPQDISVSSCTDCRAPATFFW